MGRFLLSALPLLALLACPLMMLLCMRGMRGHGNQQQTPTTSTHGATTGPPDPTSERITALERELAALRADRNGAAPAPGGASGAATRSGHPTGRPSSGDRPATEAGRGGRR
jgi:hypothetical protein